MVAVMSFHRRVGEEQLLMTEGYWQKWRLLRFYREEDRWLSVPTSFWGRIRHNVLKGMSQYIVQGQGRRIELVGPITPKSSLVGVYKEVKRRYASC